MSDGANAATLAARRIFDRVPPRIRASLTVARREAIALAADEPARADHPVNFRLGPPAPLDRVYLVLVAGRERRDAARRGRDPHRNPLGKRGNLVSVIGAAGLFHGYLPGANAPL